MAELILDGRAKLWVESEALIVTEVLQFPRKRALRFWLATGDIEACLTLHRRVLEWGAEQGCDFAITTGRKGWTKPLRVEGWTETLVVLEQEL